LTPGQATLEQVLATMGPPATQWSDPDGSRRLAYPRGPMGVATFMVDIAPDGRLVRIEDVMVMSTFAKITAGMNTEEVLRVLGPPVAVWTSHYSLRDELVWGWLTGNWNNSRDSSCCSTPRGARCDQPCCVKAGPAA
jgi:hypothetical protein